MRLIMKGGVWKNAEDEVLKAAVMKYGLNNWSRVASLLVRKTARQCKARWYEWLDPSVKKTAWSKDEDEKLLHMAKLFPTQWKTIAPLVGRTANQCLERYNQLLDIASGRDPQDPNDPRKLRPGEVDPNPETRPARADAVDLDEDEREMLAEARARLANTRGKKAKRKAREKQLDEARRVAMLQKRREMKAAGMATGERTYKRKRAGVDYENEVPFESKPKPGLYPVEDQEAPVVKNEVANMKLQEVEEMRAKERLRRLRMQDRRALRRLHERDLPTAMAKVANPFAIRKRSHLTLPEPGVTDVELAALAETVEKANAVSMESSGALSQMLRTAEGTRGLLPSTPGDMTTTLTAVGRKRRASATGELLTSAIGDTSQSVFGVDTGGSKKKRKKVSVVDLLDRLPPTANDAAIAAGLEQLLVKSTDGDGDGDIDEDERDREKRLKRKREQLLDTLAHINRRVKIFAEHLPRPLDLPTDPTSLLKMMRGGSERREADVANDLIDEEVVKLLIHDQQFLEPEEQWKMLQNPQVFHASRSVTKAFLADCAKSFTDISLKSLTKAADELEAVLSSYKVNELPPPYETVTTSLEFQEGQRVILWDSANEAYVSLHPSDEKFAQLLAENIERQIAASQKLRALKQKRLTKVQQKISVITDGYREKAKEGLARLDKLQAYKKDVDQREEASRWYLSLGGDSYFTSGQASKEMPMLYASDAVAAIANC